MGSYLNFRYKRVAEYNCIAIANNLNNIYVYIYIYLSFTQIAFSLVGWSWRSHRMLALSGGALEYNDCFSAEG